MYRSSCECHLARRHESQDGNAGRDQHHSKCDEDLHALERSGAPGLEKGPMVTIDARAEHQRVVGQRPTRDLRDEEGTHVATLDHLVHLGVRRPLAATRCGIENERQNADVTDGVEEHPWVAKDPAHREVDVPLIM